MIRYINIFRVAVKNNFSQIFAYRVNSLSGIIISLIGELLLPLMTALIYRAGASFPGWSIEEVLLLQGILIMSRGVGYMFFMSMPYIIMESVREGSFDLLLIRPVSTALLSSFISMDLTNSITFSSGFIIFIVSIIKLNIHVDFLLVITSTILFITGIFVMFGFSLIMSATMFKWVGNSRIGEIYNAIAGFGRYPTQIFPSILRTILIFFLPVALLGALPAEILLGKTQIFPIEILMILVFGIGFTLTSILIWRSMIKQYSSTGS